MCLYYTTKCKLQGSLGKKEPIWEMKKRFATKHCLQGKTDDAFKQKCTHVLEPPQNSEFSFHINSLNTKIFIKGRFWPRPHQLCAQVQLPVAGLSGLELPARPFPRGGETNPVQGLWHQVRHHCPRESRWEGQFENRNKSIFICFNKCH